MGTRQLIHDTSTCDKCTTKAAEGKPEKAKSGLLSFVETVERRNPLTGRLTLPGSEANDK
jgi:hypothetical protein